MSRSDASRHARTLIGLQADAEAVPVALRAGITLAVPLAALASAGRTDLIVYPTFAAFASVYGMGPSVRTRIAVRAEAGLWLCACIAAGTAVGTLHREWFAILATAVATLAGTLVAGRRGWRPPGPVLTVLCVAAPASVPETASRIPTALALAAVTVLLAISLDAIWVVLRPFAGGFAADQPYSRDVDRRTWRTATISGTRAAIAVTLAGSLSAGFDWGRPYWAMVAAAAAAFGPTPGDRVRRGLHRVIGTLLGLGVADAVLSVRPGVGATVAIAVACQMCAQLLIRRNYALALIFVTPLAILMVELGRHQPLGAVLRDRAIETVLGSACGIGITIAAWVAARRVGDRLPLDTVPARRT